MLSEIKNHFLLEKAKKEWRKRNPNNGTQAETIFNMDNVTVDDYSYGPLHIEQYYKPAKIKIGCYCSIAKNVVFLLGGNHSTKAITTYPFGPKIYQQESRGGYTRSGYCC